MSEYHALIDGAIFMCGAGAVQNAVDREQIDVVVDLRAESAGCVASREGLNWIQIPLGDNAPTAESELYRRAIQAVVAAYQSGKKVVFHCAMGQGRTGTVAAGVLLELGHATDVDDAAAKAKLIRSVISLQAVQKKALQQIYGK